MDGADLREKMIVCMMKGNFPELLDNHGVTTCISDNMEYLEESEKSF